MANIWMRSGLRLSIPTTLKNVNFVQRGLPLLPKPAYYTGGDANLAEKTKNIFTGQPKDASGGLIQLFSTVGTASVKGPTKPSIDKGPPGQHDNQPVNAPKEPRKDTVSDHLEKPDTTNKKKT